MRALQALRGVDLVVSVTFAAEVGDITRFDNPRQLMGYLGLVPSERSTGATVRRGGITKAGNSRVRQMLVESAWTYRFPPRIGVKKLYIHERVSPGRHHSQRCCDCRRLAGRRRRTRDRRKNLSAPLADRRGSHAGETVP